jgi:hypothetical protein
MGHLSRPNHLGTRHDHRTATTAPQLVAVHGHIVMLLLEQAAGLSPSARQPLASGSRRAAAEGLLRTSKVDPENIVVKQHHICIVKQLQRQ